MIQRAASSITFSITGRITGRITGKKPGRIPSVIRLHACVGCLIAIALSSPVASLSAMEESDDAPQADTAPAQTPPTPAELAAKQLLQMLTQVKLPRMPAMALVAMASDGVARKPAKDPLQDRVERFVITVQAGAWDRVHEVIASLPADDQGKVYDHMLGELCQNAVLLPADVIALGECAPGEITDQRLQVLGNLLRNALTLVSASGSLVAQLEVGTEHFGGQSPEKRGRAAALLLASDHVIEAGHFLPPLEPALKNQDLATIDLHARFRMAVGLAQKDPEQLRSAWDLTQAMLAHLSDADPEQSALRMSGIKRCLDLLANLPEGVGNAWLMEVFGGKPSQGRLLLAAVAAQVEALAESPDVMARIQALGTQARVVNGLLAAAALDTERWRPALNLLALGWLREAEGSIGATVNQMGDEYDQGQGFSRATPVRSTMRRGGRRIMRSNSYSYANQGGNGNDDHPPIPAVELLTLAPSAGWLANLDVALAQRLRSIIGGMVGRSGEYDQALALIAKLAPDEQQRAFELAKDLLQVWAQGRGGGNRYGMGTNGSYGGGRSYFYAGSAIPLTRARQARDLTELAKLLGEFRKLPLPPLPPELQVQAFSACHSPAEVFRAEDITAVFGDVRDLPPVASVNIVSAMRSSLAGRWRKPEVQQQAGTKRTDAETVAEVRRGYRLADQLIESALVKAPDHWRLLSGQGAILFDEAEFAYGQKVPLAEYTGLRDRAFAAFARAAASYAAGLATSDEDPSADAYVQWFQSALGASDMGYLTRQQEADVDQVGKVRAAIVALPAKAADQHLALFGAEIEMRMRSIAPELKPRYLRNALRVLGDHKSGAKARQLLSSYDDLLGEIGLSLAVDGDSTVGEHAFGIRVALRYSDALGRESGGFNRYLQNQVYTQNGEEVNYRNDFEKRLRDTLGERFEIISLAWSQPDIAPRGFGKEGWRETPLAYIAMKAKDASVDRLPSVPIDLDFADGQGQVVLPVSSAVAIIDARAHNAPTRPCRDLKITQTLDTRELAKGEASIEIQADGKGILPEPDRLLDLEVPGFTRVKIDDQGLVVTAIDPASPDAAALCQRRFQAHYQRRSGDATAEFRFPVARIAGTEAVYKRYVDADIVDAIANVPLDLGAIPRERWSRVVAAAVAVVGLASLWWWLRQSRRPVVASGPRHARPGKLTPFTVLSLLKRIDGDASLGLAERQREELRARIAELDRRFFASAEGTVGDGDAWESEAERWLTLANGAGRDAQV